MGKVPANFVGRGGALDALRFLAAIAIVIYHYGGEAPTPLEAINPIFLRGYLATDFFLVLSGFIMARVYSEALLTGAITPRDFVARRLRRIWPGHLVVLAALASFVLLASMLHISPGHPEHFRWRDLLPQMLLIQSWGTYGGGGWNLPSWSLSALVACYAAMPLILHASRRVGAPHWRVAIAILALAAADALCVGVLHRPLYDLPFQMGVLRAMPLFLLGMATAQFSVAYPVRPGVAQALLLAAGLAMGLLQGFGRFDFLSVMAVAIMLFCAGSNPVRRPSPLWRSAAQLSFALFITHVFTATIYFGVIHKLQQQYSIGARAAWLLWAVSLPTALLVAVGFDRFVDQPLQQLLTLKARIARVAKLSGPAVS